MLADRRRFMVSVFIAAAFGGADRGFAEEDRALFWRIKIRDGRSGVVFGYGPIAASLVPDVVSDGERMIERTSRVVPDLNPFTSPPMKMGKLPPLLSRLGQAVAAELRNVLTELGVTQLQLESEPGFVVAFRLIGEGQTKPVPSVGDIIVNRARARGRSITTLLTEDEVKHIIKPVDMTALNDTINETMIAFMLELRRQVGPIGAHSEKLYGDRKSDELYRFSKKLADQGVPGPDNFFNDYSDLLFSRIIGALTALPCFILVPVGMLTGSEGILERFRRQGADVRVLA
jgi:hypothetical protein